MRHMEIDRKKNSVRIGLNLFFYPERHIQQAVENFSEVCSGKISYSKNIAIIELKRKKSNVELETVGLDFCNYVLGLKQNAE